MTKSHLIKLSQNLNFLILLCRDQTGDNKDTMQCIGVPLMESIRQYEEGNYEEAVNLLYPVRYNITKLGGSDAQVGKVSTLKSQNRK